jgi:ribosomal protein uS17
MSNEETKEQEGIVEETTPTVLETVAEAAGEVIGTVETAAEAVAATVTNAPESVTNYFAPEEEAEAKGRNERKSRVGLVTSNKMDKTIAVEIQRRLQHPIYGKYVKKSKKLIAHDENNECQIGDLVRIMETRPLSRRKRWRLVTILEKAK